MKHHISNVMTTTSEDFRIIQLWLDRQSSPLTRSCYQRDVNRLLRHACKPLGNIGLADLQGFAQSLAQAGLAPASRARTLAAVKSLFGFCVRMRYIALNPAAEVVLPRYESRLAERVLSEEMVARIIAAKAEPRDRILLNILYFAGLRVSEACNLRWRNLHFRTPAGQLTVFGKNGRTRAITLPPAVWSELLTLRGSSDLEAPVFASRSGKPLDRGRVRIIVCEIAQQAGITEAVSPHWLRHAHASHALDHGAPIHLVQATLGHRSVATTSNYLHARPGDSSARFLSEFRPQTDQFRLPFPAAGVMNVSTANDSRQRRNMATFTIDTDHNITAHAQLPAGADELQSFSTAKELAKLTSEWPVSRLVDTWNSFAGVAPFDDLKPVKKFTSRNTAVARIWEAVQRLSGDAAEPAAPAATARGKAKKSPAKPTQRARAQKGAKEEGTNKKAEVIALMNRTKGVTLAEIMETTGWQKHTVRGFVSILGSKGGLKIESSKNAAGERSYHIAK